jgi:hypothetical protein
MLVKSLVVILVCCVQGYYVGRPAITGSISWGAMSPPPPHNSWTVNQFDLTCHVFRMYIQYTVYCT